MMKPLHFKMTPTSPVVTPFRGDTLVGHLLWMFAYRNGEDELARLLKSLADDPPAASDLYPENCLPRPHIPIELDDASEEYRKDIKSIRFISVGEWRALRAGLSSAAIRQLLLDKAKKQRTQRRNAAQHGKQDQPPSADLNELHNTINRLTGTTGEGGGLFARVRSHYDKDASLHGWLYPGVLGDAAFNLLKAVGLNGYGADASTGCGLFVVETLSSEGDLFNLPDADGWMSLSRHLPPAGVNVDASFWNVETHYGRLGGSYANSGNPFKKPLLLMGCGSVWRQSPAPTKPAGAILGNVAFPPLDAKVKHLGFTVPLPFKWGKS